MPKRKPINCLACKHYYVTWDRHFPYGCRKFEFKSKQVPSAEVLVSTGHRCIGFEPKEEEKGEV